MNSVSIFLYDYSFLFVIMMVFAIRNVIKLLIRSQLHYSNYFCNTL